jgi:hypothetical protein
MKRYHAQVSISYWAEDKQDAVEKLKESLEEIIESDEELEMMISEEKE